MLTANESIFIIFKFINFLIVGFVLYYAFKKYILLGVKDSIKNQVERIKSLSVEVKNKNIQLKNLEQSFLDQKNEIRQLNKKLSSWGAICVRVKEEQESLDLKVQEDINSKRKIQEENFNELQLKYKVVPDAIRCTEKLLVEKFKNEKLALNYIKELINFMQKD
jgi:flagellar motor protein MotB